MSDEMIANDAAETVADQTVTRNVRQEAQHVELDLLVPASVIVPPPAAGRTACTTARLEAHWLEMNLAAPDPLVGIAARAAAVTFANTLRRLSPPGSDGDTFATNVLFEVGKVRKMLRIPVTSPDDLEPELKQNFGSFSATAAKN